MASYVATNATLYNAGGSGDQLIPDGYIRTVEKIWLDYYSYVTAALPSSSDTILIGYIPANKKITGCEIYLPLTWTSSAINVGPSYSPAALISNSTLYQYAAATLGTLTFNKVSINTPGGVGYVITSSTTATSGSSGVLSNVNTPIYITIGLANCTLPTAGTITSILRYT